MVLNIVISVVCLFSFAFVFYLSPLGLAWFSTLVLFFSRTKNSFSVFSYLIGFIIATSIALVDLNNLYPGDISKYLAMYNSASSVEAALYDAKLYRAVIFSIMKIIGFNDWFYVFISLNLLFVLFNNTLLYFLNQENINTSRLSSKIIYLVVLFCCIPFSIVSGFESSLSLVMFLFSIKCLMKGNNKGFVLSSLIAVCIHYSVVIVIFIFLMSLLISNNFKLILYSILSIFAFSFFSNVEIITSFELVNSITGKFYRYLNGPWSRFEGKDYIYLCYAILNIMVIFAFRTFEPEKVFGIRGNKVISRFFLCFAMFSMYFITDRTLAIRYVYNFSIFLSPFLMIFLFKYQAIKSSYNKMFIVCFVVLKMLSIMNLSTLYDYIVPTKWITDYYPAVMLPDILNFESNPPLTDKANIRYE